MCKQLSNVDECGCLMSLSTIFQRYLWKSALLVEESWVPKENPQSCHIK